MSCVALYFQYTGYTIRYVILPPGSFLKYPAYNITAETLQHNIILQHSYPLYVYIVFLNTSSASQAWITFEKSTLK